MTPAERTTNLQRPPIAINIDNVVVLRNRAGRSAPIVTASSSASQPGLN